MAQGTGEVCYRRLEIDGLVQGIGFRPFIARAAAALGLCGDVRNQNGGVVLRLAGPRASLDRCAAEIKSHPLAVIVSWRERDCQPFSAEGFAVEESGGAGGSELSLLPPDRGVCADCAAEALDAFDRRHGHALISCTACGPRYTIIARQPYDRANTTMRSFPLCPRCGREYASPGDRRFRAETICCPECGPGFRYIGARGAETSGPDALERLAADLLAGGVAAVKGVSGYHLACLARDEAAVRHLRAVKGREAKPLAVMFSNIEAVRAMCEVSSQEDALLESPARPIVLLNRRDDRALAPSVCGRVNTVGCFLPGMALHILLLRQTGPLVMTSCNISESPILHRDEDAIHFAREAGIGILTNDREILRPCDDSVMQTQGRTPQFIRRSRGFVPLPVKAPVSAPRPILAMGGDLKSAFALMRGDLVYVSPHMGDLEEEGSRARFLQTLEEWKVLLGIRPEAVAADAHPGYHSTRMSLCLGLPVTLVQHHAAHAASCMADAGLCRAVAAAWDGTGYGDDGSIWGGEFFVCDERITRRGRLKPFPLVGGDSAAKDAAKVAACLSAAAGTPSDYPHIDTIRAAVRARVGTVNTSSAGRVFDAAASALGICHANAYEGQCAALLEQAAVQGKSPVLCAPVREAGGLWQVDTHALFASFCRARDTGAPVPVPALSFEFHRALAAALAEVCAHLSEESGIRDVILSGGVFQNRLLTRLASEMLRRAGLTPRIHVSVPPNDGGLALGQAMILARELGGGM